MAEVEFKVGEHTYRATSMDLFTQFHVGRRVAPMLMPVAEAMATRLGGKLGDGLGADQFKGVALDEIATLAGPIINAIGTMSDEEANGIIFPCLRVIQRQSGPGWQGLLASGTNGLMFDDLTLPDMLQLVWKVLETNLGVFFQSVPSK